VIEAFFTTKNTNGHEKISWKIRLVLAEKAISMNFSYYYHSTSCFFRKIFKNQIRKLLALRFFLIFEIFFELFDFSVMRKGNRLHAGEPPALHVASD